MELSKLLTEYVEQVKQLEQRCILEKELRIKYRETLIRVAQAPPGTVRQIIDEVIRLEGGIIHLDDHRIKSF